ncbi:MAG: DUF4157 domain-containing protein [Ferruginibacter sp.]
MSSAIKYHIKTGSLLAKLAAMKLGSRQVAFVLGSTIHLYNTSEEEFLQNKCWLKHELCHIEQFRRYGFFSFIFMYLYESVKHGYYNNKYEIEAREAEDK